MKNPRRGFRRPAAGIGVELSYFETLTAAAFLHFNAKSIDIGVLEVGMGGRWDSTNVCDHLAGVINERVL